MPVLASPCSPRASGVERVGSSTCAADCALVARAGNARVTGDHDSATDECGENTSGSASANVDRVLDVSEQDSPDVNCAKAHKTERRGGKGSGRDDNQAAR